MKEKKKKGIDKMGTKEDERRERKNKERVEEESRGQKLKGNMKK